MTDKILFGSDYPFTTPGASTEGLRALNNMVAGTNLPRVADATLDTIIHRDSLTLFGLNPRRATYGTASKPHAKGRLC